MGLEDKLLNNYSALGSTLADSGYPLMGRINGFDLYDLHNKKEDISIVFEGYLAVRKGRWNDVNKVIFWEAANLADALQNLENLPVRRPLDQHRSVSTGAIPTLLTAVSVAGVVYYFTRNIALGFFSLIGGIIAYQVADNAILPELSYQLALQSAKRRFKNRLEGKRAIREVLGVLRLPASKPDFSSATDFYITFKP